MADITTDFPTTSTTRSRADRFSDGVVASYIHSLAEHLTPAPRPAGDVTDDELPAKRTLWDCGGRVRSAIPLRRFAEAL
jgi:hypothetical protein